MTSVLSKIKNIGEQDFSSGIPESVFKLDDLARYGLLGAVSTLAFDPVQSLLAIGTDRGEIHVFGQHNVEVVYRPPKNTWAPTKFIRFVKCEYLVVVDRMSTIRVFSLEKKKLLYEHDPRTNVSSIETDPALDWLFLGLDNGQVIIYDVDRGWSPSYRIGNLQKSIDPKLHMSPVLSIAIHPRDVSTLLICYTDTAVVFSIAKGEIVTSLRYELPPGAPGGDTDRHVIVQLRRPQFLSAIWHPNGHHILTTHVDGSLVFWDAASGTLLQARTVLDSGVNIAPKNSTRLGTGEVGVRDIITKVTWNCTANPEDTSILVAGGSIQMGVTKGLTMLDFGPTPAVAVTSYQAMGAHYGSPRRHKIFPLPDETDVVDFLMLPQQSPYYAGNCNPSHFVALSTSGELVTIDYTDGSVVNDPTVLPPSLNWLNPYVTAISVSLVPRNQWVGMMNASIHSDSILKGGAPARRHLRSFQLRTALCTGHRNGIVKLWDASHGELEDSKAFEVNVTRALQEHTDVDISHISFAGSIGEMAVAVKSGKVAFFEFTKNTNALANAMGRMALREPDAVINDISHRAPPIKEGFLPQTLVNSRGDGAVTALNNSTIGFVAIGYASGKLMIVDKRGPAVMYAQSLTELSGSGSWRRSRQGAPTGASEYATVLEFGIYAINDESYSSIVLSVGTSSGNVHTLRIVPSSNGYAAQHVGSLAAFPQEPVIHLEPLNMASGTSAVAQPENMSLLSSGIFIDGALVAASRSEARIFRQPAFKVSHKKFNFACISAGISYLREGDSTAFVAVSDASELRIMAVPSLREITKRSLPVSLDPNFGKQSVVLKTGDVLLRPGKTNGALVKIWGRGVTLDSIPEDALYDVMKPLPPRPTISTIQWVRGKQYMSQDELDILIGGPRRPKSKDTIEQERSREEQTRLAELKRPSTSNSWSDSPERSSFETNSSQGRMKGIQGAFDRLEQSAAEYMNSLGDVVKETKNDAFKSSLKGRFFG